MFICWLDVCWCVVMSFVGFGLMVCRIYCSLRVGELCCYLFWLGGGLCACWGGCGCLVLQVVCLVDLLIALVWFTCCCLCCIGWWWVVWFDSVRLGLWGFVVWCCGFCYLGTFLVAVCGCLVLT